MLIEVSLLLFAVVSCAVAFFLRKDKMLVKLANIIDPSIESERFDEMPKLPPETHKTRMKHITITMKESNSPYVGHQFSATPIDDRLLTY